MSTSKRVSFLLDPKPEVGAAEFKARCLEILDAVERAAIEVTITRHRKPVAVLRPAAGQRSLKAGFFKGKLEILGDIVAPTNPDWEPDWSPETGEVT